MLWLYAKLDHNSILELLTQRNLKVGHLLERGTKNLYMTLAHDQCQRQPRLLSILMNFSLFRNNITKQSGIAHGALSRASRSHDANEPKSSQAQYERKKRNLRDNDVFLFQFLGFHVLGLNKVAPRKVLSLPFHFGFLYNENIEL